MEFAPTQADSECVSQKGGGTQYSSDLESTNGIACVKKKGRTVFVQQRNESTLTRKAGDFSGEHTPSSTMQGRSVMGAGSTPN